MSASFNPGARFLRMNLILFRHFAPEEIDRIRLAVGYRLGSSNEQKPKL
jgi:hypothetical protein